MFFFFSGHDWGNSPALNLVDDDVMGAGSGFHRDPKHSTNLSQGYKVVPATTIAKLVNITPISL